MPREISARSWLFTSLAVARVDALAWTLIVTPTE